MFCQKCGKEIQEGAAFCTNCGAPQNAAPVQPAQPVQQAAPAYQAPVQQEAPTYQYAQPQPNAFNPDAPKPHNGSVSFGEAIKLYFQNYVNFTGRASKSEYWWAVLFTAIVSVATSWIPFIGTVISLAFFLPGLSLCVRRLHDIGKSWVYYLMGLIPIAGFIILLVYFCKDSDGDNQWGPGPV